MRWLVVLLPVLVACRAGAAAGDAVAERQVVLLVAKSGALSLHPRLSPSSAVSTCASGMGQRFVA